MGRIFFSTGAILSFTFIALPGWATNSKTFMGANRNLAQVLSYSDFPQSISINLIQKSRKIARTRLENNLILAAGKTNKNFVDQQKSTPRPSPQRGAPKPKPERD
jgi:hypothetical protein